MKELVELQNMEQTEEVIGMIKSHTMKVEDCQKREEQFWYQRSRVLWLWWGDKNTKFFHQKTLQRRQRNIISRLKNDEEQWVEDEVELSQLFEQYFQKLFISVGQRDWSSVLSHVPKVISEDVNSVLTRPITDDEIKKAAFSIGALKAPGPDGYNGLFFQQYWDIVGWDVTKAVQEFFRGGVMPGEWNDTSIVLVPKVKVPESVSQFRPINLCNVCYKIISKVLVLRLKNFLPEAITDNQAAFLSQKVIHDNIVIAHEASHYLKRKKKGKVGELGLKMDMNKAYDRLEWDFIEAVLLRMGFHQVWVNWIMQCITTVSYSIVLNGKKMGAIKPERGVRQGDPLSPYLFIIIADVLSRMIIDAANDKSLKGIKLSRYCPILTHLLFADDSLFFILASTDNCKKLIDIINEYCAASGQMVNLSKSTIMFSPNTCPRIRDDICSQFNIPSTDNPGKYLGLPTIWGRSKHEALGFVKEKIIARVKGWKEQFLSPAAKEILVKTVASAAPVYSMSVLKFLAKTCKELNSIISNFWWGQNEGKNKIHWKS